VLLSTAHCDRTLKMQEWKYQRGFNQN